MTNEKIHVGVDATSWINDRGFGRFTRELVTALLERDAGFEYSLVFDRPPNFELPDNVNVIVGQTENSLNEAAVGDNSRSINYLMKMGEAVRRAKFDIFFFPAVYSYFPLLARVPCIVCYHDTTAERIPHLLFPTKRNHRLWQLKTAMAKMQTKRAMTVSQSSARDLENILKIPKHKIDVVSEAADPTFKLIDDREQINATKQKYDIPLSAKYMMTLGGMNAHKNILRMLQAMPAVVAQHPDAFLVIVGDTSGKGFWDNVPELKQFVADNPSIADNVRFTGYIDDLEAALLLNDAAALAFPSLWEGFGLPAVEAMSCGAPVLASNRGSLPEVVGDAGLFYDPENLDEITQCVLRFYGDAALQNRLRQSAISRSKEFTWENAAVLAEQSFLKCANRSRA